MQNILVMGGDKRQILLTRRLNELGYNAVYYDKEQPGIAFDALILPYPVAKDGVTLNAPLSKENILLNDIYKYVRPGGKILGGNLPKDFCNNPSFIFTDYAKDEILLYKNAVLTAQAALCLIMNETQKPLSNSKITVVGLGRIGGLLSEYLLPLGADITVVTGNSKKLAYCKAKGIKAVDTKNIGGILGESDVIVNTSPNSVFCGDVLTQIKKDAVYFELASAPYGIDFAAAEKCGIKTVKGFGLPGRYFSISACECILESILKHLGE